MLKPIKILHIEDDPLYASLMEAILTEDTGQDCYEVVQVESLNKALRHMKEEEFGAIILDLSLHDVSGLDGVRALKNENADMPIIVVSGLDNENTAMKALDEGAQDYIIKGHANHKVIRMAIKSSIRRKAMERDLYHKANFDDLTGLMNRRYFIDHLQRALVRAKRWEGRETLLFIDVDRFKHINDTHGHAAGNAVLQEVGRRITGALRATDMVARYGGDEFVVLLDDRSDAGEASTATVVSKIQALFTPPLQWEGHAIAFSVSIGVAAYPEAGATASVLLDHADKAMYEAKKKGREPRCSGELSAESA